MPNTIADNLARLQTARTDIANAITTMGGTLTSGDGFEDFPAEILGIPAGGTEEIIGTVVPISGFATSGKVKQLDRYIRLDLGIINTLSHGQSMPSGSSICTLQNLQLTGLRFFKKWYFNDSYKNSSQFFSASFGSSITATSVNLILDEQVTWREIGDTYYLGILYELIHE